MSYLDFPAERFMKEEELLTIFTNAVTDELNKDLEERLVEGGLKIDQLEEQHNVLLEMLVNRERELRLLSEIFHLYKQKCSDYEKLHVEVTEQSTASHETYKLLKEFSESLEHKYNTQSDYLNEVETQYHDCKIKLESANFELESLRIIKEKYLVYFPDDLISEKNLEKEDEHKAHDIARLKEDVEILQKKLTTCNLELESLKEHNEILNLEKQSSLQLEEENSNLTSSYSYLQKQYDTAVEEIGNLRHQNHNLREFIDKLQAKPELDLDREPELPPLIEEKEDENLNHKLEKIKKGHFRRSSDIVGSGKRVHMYETVEPEESTTNSSQENFNKDWSEEKPSPRSRNRANHKSMDFDNANLTNISPNKDLQKKKEEREKARAKDMYEEYYALTYSSVLMNCPYFDEILEFEGKKKSLYEQIKKEGMPYHTWYKWIEGQLNKYYESLKAKKNPTKPVIGKPSAQKVVPVSSQTKLGQQKRKLFPF